jgi:hypothetical protein
MDVKLYLCMYVCMYQRRDIGLNSLFLGGDSIEESSGHGRVVTMELACKKWWVYYTFVYVYT